LGLHFELVATPEDTRDIARMKELAGSVNAARMEADQILARIFGRHRTSELGGLVQLGVTTHDFERDYYSIFGRHE